MMKTWVKKAGILTISLLAVYHNLSAGASLSSGKLSVEAIRVGDSYNLSFIFEGTPVALLDADYPVSLEVDSRSVSGRYSSCTRQDDRLVCQVVLQSPRGSQFAVSDTFIAKGSGIIELQRNLNVLKVAKGDNYFNSLFGFEVDSNNHHLLENEYFVPGVWYKANFTAAGNIPANIPQASDSLFYYREDRITLPVVMFREPSSGHTLAIIHKDSENMTVVADGNGVQINENYQYGAVGFRRFDKQVQEVFIYPGNEKTTRKGKGVRSHPVKQGIRHAYRLDITFSKTDSYAEAVGQSWDRAFEMYNPPIYPVDLGATYRGVIATLDNYYVPPIELGGVRDAGGFPFEVSLKTFKPVGIDYQMGFVGMQIATAYYLFRDGVENDNAVTRAKGEEVLNFWANNCLSSLGYPRTWYDPGLNGTAGSWRSGSDIRVATGGMEALTTAWCYAKRNGLDNADNQAWIDAAECFGDWLVTNQNDDGSYYFSYNHDKIIDGKHPVSNHNKYLTICAIRYLVELYIATNDESYRTAALRAGEFCYTNIHQAYTYVACVVDNPQTIDSESGLMAMNGFLSLYDLTRQTRWLTAAQQAAKYTETWVYCFQIPVEDDRTTDNFAFPKSRSIVGQHLIAIGHSYSDLGFAWASFAYYRLYLATGNEHYLRVARLSAHNSKQSMNWDGSLFADQPAGLQLEAFSVTVPRRVKSVLTTLNWNYAAHLDPMMRFKDAFGTPDLEEVEKLSWHKRRRLVRHYARVQSSNWGQNGHKP
jgi:hypothetical protein